jgi:hypothetical protein
MPTAGGPNTLGESNLVFAYDTGDVKNSYVGEPTTNVATGTLTPYTPYNTMTRSGQDLTITMVGGSALYLTFHNGTDYNGQTITLSGYMFKNGIPHTLPNNRANTYHTVAASKWYFDSVTGYFEIVEVCNASSIWLFHTPSGASGGDVITILDFQVEVKPHATPFVAGTRSSTQGLLPLIGNSTIDLSNVSFDSSAKMVFDGTNDYMVTSTAIPCNFGTGDFAVEVLIYPESFASYAHMVALPNQSTFALKANISDGAIYYYDPAFSTYGSTSGWTLTLNQWNHVVLVRSGNIAYAYLNGVSKGSKTGFNTNFSSTQIVNVGNGGVAEYTQKRVDVVKIYNRALTAQEVKQNYQQYKTRFNLS